MPHHKDLKGDAGEAVANASADLAKALDDLREEVSKLNRRDRGGPPRGILLLLLLAAVAVAAAVLNGRQGGSDDSDDWG